MEYVDWIMVKQDELNADEAGFIEQMEKIECRGITEPQADWIVKIFDRVCNE